MSRAEQLRVTDAATVARAVAAADSGPLAGLDRPLCPEQLSPPAPGQPAVAGRARLAHYSKSGMQSRAAAAADNNFLGRTFFVAEFSRQQFSPFSSFSRTLPSDSDRSLLAPLKLHFGYCAAEAPRAGGSGGDGRWRGERKRGEGGTKGTAPRGGESSANGRRVSQSESNGGESSDERRTKERTAGGRGEGIATDSGVWQISAWKWHRWGGEGEV